MQALWSRVHSSVFSLTFENAAGERLTSGSGFKVAGHLVTNNHVIQVPSARRVVFRSVAQDAFSPAFHASFGQLHFSSMLRSGQEEARWDYAIFAVDHPDFAAIPDLELKDTDEFAIGSSAAFLGFQFEQPNLAIHSGVLASSFVKSGVRYIQIDGSINHGNSGGPLIDLADGRVLGIVTRKATGLTEEFAALDEALATNIRLLSEANRGSRVAIMGIDPIAATRTVQEQIRIIARNVGRSANVGIGYAYHISEVRTALELL